MGVVPVPVEEVKARCTSRFQRFVHFHWIRRRVDDRQQPGQQAAARRVSQKPCDSRSNTLVGTATMPINAVAIVNLSRSVQTDRDSNVVGCEQIDETV